MKSTLFTSEALSQSKNLVIEELRKDDLLCLMPDQHLPPLAVTLTKEEIEEQEIKYARQFFNDASRPLTINGFSFKESPEFKSLNEESKDEQIKIALKTFFNRVLPSKSNDPSAALDFLKFIRFWNQGLFATPSHAIGLSILWPATLLNADNQINIGRTSNGTIFIEIITSNVRFTVPPKTTEFAHIPGTVVTRFHLTEKGFKLKWINCSNQLLTSFFQNAKVHIIDQKLFPANSPRIQKEKNVNGIPLNAVLISKAQKEELAHFSTLLQNENLPYVSKENAVKIIEVIRSSLEKLALAKKAPVLFYDILSLLTYFIQNPHNKNSLVLLNKFIDSLPSEIKDSPAYSLLKHNIELLTLLEIDPLPNKAMLSPFGRYLKEQKKLNSNLDKYSTNHAISQYGPSRIFNDFTSYDGVLPLLETRHEAFPHNDSLEISEELPADTPERANWLDFATAIAIHNLFDEQGNFRKDIFTLLNKNNYLQNLIDRFGKDKVKRDVLGTFITNIIGPDVTKLKNEHPYDMVLLVRSTNSLNGKILISSELAAPIINGDYIQELNKRLSNFAVPPFHSSLLKTKIVLFQFNKALEELELIINDHQKNKDLRIAAKEVLDEVKLLKAETSSPERIQKLTEALIATKEIVDNPTPEKIDVYKNLAKEISKPSWGKKLGAAMLVLTGVALIAVSILSAVASAGIAAPISVGGTVLGATFVAAAFGVTAASSGLAASIAGGFTLFKLAKPELKKKMDDLADKAKP